MSGVGIEGINAYCGLAQLSIAELFEGRGLDSSRIGNLMLDHRSVMMPWEDPITNAVNAAKPLVDGLGKAAAGVELLVVSSESGVDFSKSIASYAHRYLGLSRRCRILEVKQACYGATGMVQLASGYLAARSDPATRALVIAADISPMDEHAHYAEPTMGNGAVAMLLSGQPRVLSLDVGRSGICSFEAMDTARPSADRDFVDPDLSLLSYLECLSGSFQDFVRLSPGTDFATSFDHIVMHTPFPGMVRAAHRKMMRELTPAPPREIAEDFARRVGPSLEYGRTVGNLCSGSIYLALASLIDHAQDVEGRRVGFYSYGSGCASEFFSGTLSPGASAVVAAARIGERIRLRTKIDFAEYAKFVPYARDCLLPSENRTVDLSNCLEMISPLREFGPLLVLAGIENFHRRYEWR